VLVGYDGKAWISGNFVGFRDEKHREYTISFKGTMDMSYPHCKPDPDAVSLPNWIEHDGSDIYVNCSEGEIIVGIYSSTRQQYISGKDGNKLHLLGMSRYCIIPLPEFL